VPERVAAPTRPEFLAESDYVNVNFLFACESDVAVSDTNF